MTLPRLHSVSNRRIFCASGPAWAHLNVHALQHNTLFRPRGLGLEGRTRRSRPRRDMRYAFADMRPGQLETGFPTVALMTSLLYTGPASRRTGNPIHTCRP